MTDEAFKKIIFFFFWICQRALGQVCIYFARNIELMTIHAALLKDNDDHVDNMLGNRLNFASSKTDSFHFKSFDLNGLEKNRKKNPYKDQTAS